MLKASQLKPFHHDNSTYLHLLLLSYGEQYEYAVPL